MAGIAVDYLVVGAGASGMAFVDALVALDPEAEVLLVDRRHRPGGHWIDAYPFVRLHQPSATYGVNSRQLGDRRIDGSGANAGFYERATGAEIVAYYDKVLEEVLLPTGRVRFLGMTDHRGENGGEHSLVSLLTGETTTVQVRRRVVDATYTASSIPSRHAPAFTVEEDAAFIAPNDLVRLEAPASGYTVIGGGKTSMDTCSWLLESGVDPDRIRWVRARDGWFFNRAYTQPLEQVGSFMQLQARWLAAAAAASDAQDFAGQLEAAEVFLRIDRDIVPTMFRGATVSVDETEALGSIGDVVRLGRVRHVRSDRIVFDGGDLPTGADHVYVDCTAAGVPATTVRPIFEPGRITLQIITLGFVPWSAATIGAVEALKDDDEVRNGLCPPLVFTGHVDDILEFARVGIEGLGARSADKEISAWTDSCRLNPAMGASRHLADPRVKDAYTIMGETFFPAVENLQRLT